MEQQMKKEHKSGWMVSGSSSFGPVFREYIRAIQGVSSGSTDPAPDVPMIIHDSTYFLVQPVSSSTSSDAEAITSIMGLGEMEQRLRELESKHGISSEEFYERWKDGDAGDGFDSLMWIVLYNAWQNQNAHR